MKNKNGSGLKKKIKTNNKYELKFCYQDDDISNSELLRTKPLVS